MDYFTSIFHEANIPMEKPPAQNDIRVNMTIPTSMRNVPKIKTLINQQNIQDAKKKNDQAKATERAAKNGDVPPVVTSESFLIDRIEII